MHIENPNPRKHWLKGQPMATLMGRGGLFLQMIDAFPYFWKQGCKFPCPPHINHDVQPLTSDRRILRCSFIHLQGGNIYSFADKFENYFTDFTWKFYGFSSSLYMYWKKIWFFLSMLKLFFVGPNTDIFDYIYMEICPTINMKKRIVWNIYIF